MNCIAPGFTLSEGVEANTFYDGSFKTSNVATRALARDATPQDMLGPARLPLFRRQQLHDRTDRRRRRRLRHALSEKNHGYANAAARHWIGGTWCRSSSGLEAERRDPATGEFVGRFADGNAEDAEAAVEAAHETFLATDWAHDARLRQNVLLAWASNLEADRERVAELLTRENGKILRQAQGEVAAAISEIRYYAGQARAIRGNAHGNRAGDLFHDTSARPPALRASSFPGTGPCCS